MPFAYDQDLDTREGPFDRLEVERELRRRVKAALAQGGTKSA